MAPNYYYELNETSTEGGAVDSTGNAAPGLYNGDYANGPMVGAPGPLEVFDGIAVPGVGGAANLSHASNNAGHITLGDGNDYGANAITVAMFLKAGPAQGGDRIFTNNLTDPTKSFQIVTGNSGLVLAVDPTQAGANAERTLYLEDNSGPDRRLINADSGWFHIIASTSGATGAERAANFRLWVNGVDRTGNLQPDSVGWGTDTGMAKIGGRRDNAGDSTTHSGAQDEVAIWLDRVLTPEDAQKLWQAAITAPTQPDGDDDDDGLPNWFEVIITGDPNDTTGADPEGNNDGDDYTNLEELNFGTDPTDPTDQPVVVPEVVGGVLVISLLDSVVGNLYSLERSTDAINFTTVLADVAGTGGIIEFQDEDPGLAKVVIYRVRVRRAD